MEQKSWYYQLDGYTIGPVSEATVQHHIASGSITADTMIRSEQTVEWTPARSSELADLIAATPLAKPISPQFDPQLLPGYKKSALLVNSLRTFLALLLLTTLANVLSGMMHYRLLTNFRDGTAMSTEQFMVQADAADLRMGLIGLIWFAFLLVSLFLFFVWVFRANRNAHSLGATGMQFSAGWAVGWFFIPFANLWKPYQVMREIWNASESPTAWWYKDGNIVLYAWWGLWLASTFVVRILPDLPESTASVSELGVSINALEIWVISDLVDTLFFALTLILVSRIYHFQNEHYKVRTELTESSPMPTSWTRSESPA